MTRTFNLPDLGEGLQEAEIVAWHVGVGDHVVPDQPLVSVETDKAVVEIPSPHGGHVARLHAAAGDVVAVGAPLIEFADRPAEDKGAIVGEVSKAGSKPRAAPAVRRRARELGVDLATVIPSGPDGSITSEDLERAASSRNGGERLRGVRRAMLRNMVRAGREVVPATVTDEADIAGWPDSADVTVRLIRAVAAGCVASPSLNAWFDAEREIRTLHRHVDLGIAVETEEGLFAPVMRDVGARDAADLRRGVEAMKKDIAARAIPHDELVGQTVTLSNFGMFGGRFADLVVVPPQVAILGAGRAEPRIVAVGGAPAVRRMLPLSLSFDHRVVTGVEAARFLNAVIEDLEKQD